MPEVGRDRPWRGEALWMSRSAVGRDRASAGESAAYRLSTPCLANSRVRHSIVARMLEIADMSPVGMIGSRGPEPARPMRSLVKAEAPLLIGTWYALQLTGGAIRRQGVFLKIRRRLVHRRRRRLSTPVHSGAGFVHRLLHSFVHSPCTARI